MVIWDDGDDLYAEPRAPYPHARDVLLIRARQQNTAALHRRIRTLGGGRFPGSVGWAHEIAVSRATLRERVTVTSRVQKPTRIGIHTVVVPGFLGWSSTRSVVDSRKGRSSVQTPRAGLCPVLGL